MNREQSVYAGFPAKPPRKRLGLGVRLWKTLWQQPLYAIPFALFFGVLYGGSRLDFVTAYKFSLVFAYTIRLALELLEFFVLPRLRKGGPTGRVPLPLEILLVSFGMLLPLTIAVGILVTFRIAGPVYRFEKYLKQVIDGEEVGPCRIRDGDEFQELCELINQATAPLREARTSEPKKTEEERPELRKAG